MKLVIKFLCFISLFIASKALFSQVYSPLVDSVAMRDGKKLAVDIYLPQGSTPKPTILIQTPYNRLFYRWGLPMGIAGNLNSYGYNFVIADWRGFYGSLNAYVANYNRGLDGYDLVEWISQQPWSDGKTGTWGPSALGKIQYMTAKENPPHLVCCVPLVSGSQFSYSEYFPGGALRTEYLQQLDALGYGLSPFIMAYPFYNLIWQYTENINYYPDMIGVPCLMIGGWYDHNVEVMLDLFDGIKQNSPVTVRDKHKLLMGPWAHGGFGPVQVGTCTQGELTFNEACGWSDSLALRFFDFYLRNINNGWDSEPVIRYFQTGENFWKSTQQWPPSGYTNVNFYFRENNFLDEQAPSLANSYSQILYNPANPSPTQGGPTLRQDLLQGPYDQAQVVESRNDVLVFTGAILAEPLEIAGKPKVTLYVSGNRKDTDFAVRLCDLYPDGRSVLISDGIKRMRFRNGYTTADTASMISGLIYQIEIELPNTAYTFMPGHAVRLDVTSSNYPRFDNNLNNGLAMYTQGDTLIATNNIYHQTGNFSCLQLPVATGSGFNNSEHNTVYNIYPNPSSGELNITWNDRPGRHKIEITDITGKILLSEYIDNPGIISLKNISSGSYCVTLINNNNISETKRIILY